MLKQPVFRFEMMHYIFKKKKKKKDFKTVEFFAEDKGDFAQHKGTLPSVDLKCSTSTSMEMHGFYWTRRGGEKSNVSSN